jgi:hypothetical protein
MNPMNFSGIPNSREASMRRSGRTLRIAIAVAAFAQLTASRNACAQDIDVVAKRALRDAKTLALQGNADSALALFASTVDMAKKMNDNTLAVAAMIGASDVYLVYRNCNDSALVMLRNAAAVADPGDRSASDALVRLLALRGATDEAQKVLTQAYGSVENVGRSITRESMNWFRGLATIQKASGKESAALASLNSALMIAQRLASGDQTDSSVTKSTDVTPLDFWIVYDLAQLRLDARSTTVASKSTGMGLMNSLVKAGVDFDGRDELQYPESRLADRLILRSFQCEAKGSRCTQPPTFRCNNH